MNISRLEKRLENQTRSVKETETSMANYRTHGAQASQLLGLEAQLRRQKAALAQTTAILELERKIAKAGKK